MSTRPLLLAFVTALLVASARAQSFQPGDLWIVSQGIYDNGAYKQGVGHVNTATGTAQFVTPFASTYVAASTFDTFRNGIIVTASPIGVPIFEFTLVKGDGSFTTLGVPAFGTKALAATGDGRIYIARGTQPHALEYLDAANAVHTVLDSTGAAAFVIPAPHTERAMIYDSATNSLFLGATDVGLCGFGYETALVMKIPLSADGTRVAGPVQSMPICASGATSATVIVNFSDGPAGKILAIVDDNSNDAVGRMVTIDKATLALSTFATNGPYVGAAATTCGVYSHVLGKAVIDDGFSFVLRQFSAGEFGSGTPWVANDGISVHADASMIEVPGSLTTGLATYGTGTAGCAGAQALFANGTPKVGAANFRFTCTNAPPSALGLLLVGNVPDLAGSDPFGFGALLHVNLFLSTFLDGLNLNSNAAGLGTSPAPIPILPSLVGQTVDAQAIWVWSGCATPSPLGISTSTGLAVTFQP